MTSDERREVAERLRSCIPDRSGMVSTAEVIGAFDVDTIGNRVFFDGALRIADLIDPTCRMEPEGDGFRCSACGTYHDMSGFEEFPWPRCPECGARVVKGR